MVHCIMLIVGSSEYLEDFKYRALVVTDVFMSDNHLWVMAPVYEFDAGAGLYLEEIRILSSPKNAKAAMELVNEHNRIYELIHDSPLGKVLNEEN